MSMSPGTGQNNTHKGDPKPPIPCGRSSPSSGWSGSALSAWTPGTAMLDRAVLRPSKVHSVVYWKYQCKVLSWSCRWCTVQAFVGDFFLACTRTWRPVCTMSLWHQWGWRVKVTVHSYDCRWHCRSILWKIVSLWARRRLWFAPSEYFQKFFMVNFVEHSALWRSTWVYNKKPIWFQTSSFISRISSITTLMFLSFGMSMALSSYSSYLSSWANPSFSSLLPPLAWTGVSILPGDLAYQDRSSTHTIEPHGSQWKKYTASH